MSDISSSQRTLDSVHNFGIIWKSGKRAIVQFDFPSTQISLIERGVIKKAYPFHDLLHFNAEEDLHITLKFQERDPLDFEADNVEEKYVICRLLSFVLEHGFPESEEDENYQDPTVVPEIRKAFSLAAHPRKVIKDGVLEKKGNTTIAVWAKRRIKICPGEFSYFKPGDENALNIIQIWDGACTVKKSGTNGFVVSIKDRNYYFRLVSDSQRPSTNLEPERTEWIKAFKDACQDRRRTVRILNPARQLQRYSDGSSYVSQTSISSRLPLPDEYRIPRAGLNRQDKSPSQPAQVPSKRPLPPTPSTDRENDPVYQNANQNYPSNKPTASQNNGTAQQHQRLNQRTSVEIAEQQIISELDEIIQREEDSDEEDDKNDNNSPHPDTSPSHNIHLSVVGRTDPLFSPSKHRAKPPANRKRGDVHSKGSEDDTLQQTYQNEDIFSFPRDVTSENNENTPISSTAPVNHLQQNGVSPGGSPRDAGGQYSRFISTNNVVQRASGVYKTDISIAGKDNESIGGQKVSRGLPRTPLYDENSDQSLREMGPPSRPSEDSVPKLPPTPLPKPNRENSVRLPPGGAPPSAAPPPVPPMPPPFQNRQPVSKRDIKWAPSVKLKQAHWTKVPPQLVQKSVWRNVQDVTDKLQRNLLEDQFAIFDRAVTPMSPISPKTREGKQLLLDNVRAQNLAIIINGLKTDGALDVSSVLNSITENEKFPADKLTSIRRYQPTDDEIEMYKMYRDQREQLHPVDQFMLGLCEIPCLGLRLDLVLTLWDVPRQYEYTSQMVELLWTACEEILRSESLVATLEYLLAIGNYMNAGWNEGSGAIGFQISSIDKLLDVRGFNPHYTLVHFLVEQLQVTDPQLLDWTSSIKTVTKCGSYSVKAVGAEIEVLKGDMGKLKKNLHIVRGKLPKPTMEDVTFHQNAQKVISDYENRLDQLDRKSGTLQNKYRMLLEKFGESRHQASDEFFATLCRFVEKFQLAKQEIQRGGRKGTQTL